MLEAESVLTHLSIFQHLRSDEIGSIARSFAIDRLPAGERRSFDEVDGGRLVVVLRGLLDITIAGTGPSLRSTLATGDRFGTLTLLTGYVRPFTLAAREDSTIATIDRAGFDALLGRYPAIALPLASELATELASRNDLVRQLLELHAEELPPEELRCAIEERRALHQRHGARVARLSPRALFRSLVVQQGAEPPFWMLAGFFVSLGGARLVVHLILKYKLEKELFALVPGADPNPMHVHHFNYGLVLIGAAGLAALFPLGRRGLRVLAFAFGLGAGLVFDEFALFWNLNPEYAQNMSLIAAAMAATALVQLVWFRKFWAALAQRLWLRTRGVR